MGIPSLIGPHYPTNKAPYRLVRPFLVEVDISTDFYLTPLRIQLMAVFLGIFIVGKRFRFSGAIIANFSL